MTNIITNKGVYMVFETPPIEEAGLEGSDTMRNKPYLSETERFLIFLTVIAVPTAYVIIALFNNI